MIPTREQLESKWWHRFFKVILIVSTIIWLFVLIVILNEEGVFNDWEKSKYAYSFESDYNKYEGRVENCFYSDIYGNFPIGVPIKLGQKPPIIARSLKCGDLTTSEFISRYCVSKPTNQICIKTEPKTEAERIFASGTLLYHPGVEKIINSEGVKSKLIYYWDWKAFLLSILSIIAGIVGWIALLKYGVYKAILYVAYGRK